MLSAVHIFSCTLNLDTFEVDYVKSTVMTFRAKRTVSEWWPCKKLVVGSRYRIRQ
jgi:hypothetical protein